MDKFIKLTDVMCKETLKIKRKYPFLELFNFYVKRENLLCIASIYDNMAEELHTVVQIQEKNKRGKRGTAFYAVAETPEQIIEMLEK